jgi:transcriptional regulator with XRE-family HTH domain
MDRAPFRRNWDGTFVVWPEPQMVAVGARFRNGRRQAGLSQSTLASRSGVSQSVISRFERGLVTGMSVERLVRIANALRADFPFGFCPHHDNCAYPRNASVTSWLR